MTKWALYQCENCELVVPVPDDPCPGCGAEPGAWSDVRPGEIDWTAEAKERVHQYANELVDTRDFDLCLHAFLTQVMTPLNDGEPIPGSVQRHYVNQLISVAAISVYASLFGIDVTDLRLDLEQMEEGVESVLEDLAEEGYEGTAQWQETEDGGAILATFPEGLTAPAESGDAQKLLAALREGVIVTNLTDGQRGELVSAAQKAGITTVFSGHHEAFGGWVGTTRLEDALENDDFMPDPARMAGIIQEHPRVIEELLSDDSQKVPGGPYPECLAESVRVLLQRGKMIVGLPPALYDAVIDVCHEYDVDFQRGTHDIEGRTLRWIAHPDSEIEEKLEAWTEHLS